MFSYMLCLPPSLKQDDIVNLNMQKEAVQSWQQIDYFWCGKCYLEKVMRPLYNVPLCCMWSAMKIAVDQ